MKLLWASDAWEDYLLWQRSDPAAVAKINLLLAEIRRQPFKGLGKPEPLKGHLTGWWSRRITGEHRLVYRVAGSGDTQQVEIVQCRYHY
ncbi:MAG: Txe/YoeB family addiction module toxin [Geminicoccaceae bacterium]